MSLDQLERIRAESRRIGIMDHITRMQEAEETGMAKGLAQGEARGELLGRVKSFVQFLEHLGKPVRREATNLSEMTIAELETLAKQLETDLKN